MSANERMGWRDEELSRRHREWGYDCPAVDIDFLMIEYDRSMPKAIIDYKYWQELFIDRTTASARALISLANSAKIPACYVYYSFSNGICQGLIVHGLNKEYAPNTYRSPIYLSERMYVSMLYRTIRKREVPDDISDQLSDLVLQAPPSVEVFKW